MFLLMLAGAVMTAEGFGFTATLLDPMEEQVAAFHTVTPRVTGDVVPAENVMLREPAPAVMVPPVTVQL